MIKVSDVIAVVRDFASESLQEKWDNSGVQVGYNLDDECRGVVLSLDVTEQAVEMAVVQSCNLVITHHPLTISGERNFGAESEFGRILSLAVKNGVVIYSAHTSLDSCCGGLNDYLAELVGLRGIEVLIPSGVDNSVGLGRVGELSQAVSAEELAVMLREKLGAEGVRYCDGGRAVRRVALCTGSGASLLSDVERLGVDAYICGDLKYHNFTEMASKGLTLVDVGHFESEICAIDIFERIISKNFTTFAVLKSRNNTINYL